MLFGSSLILLESLHFILLNAATFVGNNPLWDEQEADGSTRDKFANSSLAKSVFYPWLLLCKILDKVWNKNKKTLQQSVGDLWWEEDQIKGGSSRWIFVSNHLISKYLDQCRTGEGRDQEHSHTAQGHYTIFNITVFHLFSLCYSNKETSLYSSLCDHSRPNVG